ncbi:YfcC family protein, partial [Citrobacter sp. AAK_AS5]
AKASKLGFRFPGAVTTLAIVVVLVWVAALFIPSGRYLTDADGSPIPGTYQQTESPLGVSETIEQLVLAPINGIYGLRSI